MGLEFQPSKEDNLVYVYRLSTKALFSMSPRISLLAVIGQMDVSIDNSVYVCL